ncbi:response regulator [Qipengyuania sp. CAU 1752]
MSAQRILIVDDDTILSGLLQLTLELEGYAVTTAANGAEALARLEVEKFDLIILDIVMPTMDGIKFLRVLGDSNLERPPIIVISSKAGNELTDHYRSFGVVGIARKPVEPGLLVQRVSAALQGQP